MSYIRYGSEFQFVEGTSEDYIYLDGEGIVDYGSCTDRTLVEFVYQCLLKQHEDDDLFKEYVFRKLFGRIPDQGLVVIFEKAIGIPSFLTLEERKDVARRIAEELKVKVR